MNATTHAVFGIAALTGVSLVVGEAPPLYAYPVAVVAAWIPDVDNPRSRLGNGLSRTRSRIVNTIAYPVSWALRATSFVLFRTVGHRTLTHSLLGLGILVALASPVASFSPELFLVLVAGYASHLVADALNTRGIRLLWPMKQRFRLVPRGVRSGGAAEFIVALVVAVTAGCGTYVLHPALAGMFAPGIF